MTDEEAMKVMDVDMVIPNEKAKGMRELKIMSIARNKCVVCGQQATCITAVGNIYLCDDSECCQHVEAGEVLRRE